MLRDTSMTLDDYSVDFIDKQVAAGRYDAASGVVRAGLWLLEEHEARVKALQDALLSGERSGQPHPFERDAVLRRIHARHGACHRE